jgi:truncated hemoglobin YjbI
VRLPALSLYEHAGGDDALHRREEIFYSKVLADLVLRVGAVNSDLRLNVVLL